MPEKKSGASVSIMPGPLTVTEREFVELTRTYVRDVCSWLNVHLGAAQFFLDTVHVVQADMEMRRDNGLSTAASAVAAAKTLASCCSNPAPEMPFVDYEATISSPFIANLNATLGKMAKWTVDERIQSVLSSGVSSTTCTVLREFAYLLPDDPQLHKLPSASELLTHVMKIFNDACQAGCVWIAMPPVDTVWTSNEPVLIHNAVVACLERLQESTRLRKHLITYMNYLNVAMRREWIKTLIPTPSPSMPPRGVSALMTPKSETPPSDNGAGAGTTTTTNMSVKSRDRRAARRKAGKQQRQEQQSGVDDSLLRALAAGAVFAAASAVNLSNPPHSTENVLQVLKNDGKSSTDETAVTMVDVPPDANQLLPQVENPVVACSNDVVTNHFRPKYDDLLFDVHARQTTKEKALASLSKLMAEETNAWQGKDIPELVCVQQGLIRCNVEHEIRIAFADETAPVSPSIMESCGWPMSPQFDHRPCSPSHPPHKSDSSTVGTTVSSSTSSTSSTVTTTTTTDPDLAPQESKPLETTMPPPVPRIPVAKEVVIEVPPPSDPPLVSSPESLKEMRRAKRIEHLQRKRSARKTKREQKRMMCEDKNVVVAVSAVAAPLCEQPPPFKHVDKCPDASLPQETRLDQVPTGSSDVVFSPRVDKPQQDIKESAKKVEMQEAPSGTGTHVCLPGPETKRDPLPPTVTESVITIGVASVVLPKSTPKIENSVQVTMPRNVICGTIASLGPQPCLFTTTLSSSPKTRDTTTDQQVSSPKQAVCVTAAEPCRLETPVLGRGGCRLRRGAALSSTPYVRRPRRSRSHPAIVAKVKPIPLATAMSKSDPVTTIPTEKDPPLPLPMPISSSSPLIKHEPLVMPTTPSNTPQNPAPLVSIPEQANLPVQPPAPPIVSPTITTTTTTPTTPGLIPSAVDLRLQQLAKNFLMCLSESEFGGPVTPRVMCWNQTIQFFHNMTQLVHMSVQQPKLLNTILDACKQMGVGLANVPAMTPEDFTRPVVCGVMSLSRTTSQMLQYVISGQLGTLPGTQ